VEDPDQWPFGFLLALILAVCAAAFSQSASGRSSITGVVHDQAAPAIVGARVQLSGAVTLSNRLRPINPAVLNSSESRSASIKFKSPPKASSPEPFDVVVGSQPRAPLQS